MDRLWVFGYGSLIWNPEFPVDQAVVARLDHWHRSFCMQSIHYRGTLDAPGLVLALDEAPDAHCNGVAFQVAAGAEVETLAALRQRELISDAYLEARLPVSLSTGGTVEAVAFVINRANPQYCGRLALEDQACIIATARGNRGDNRDYLFATADHLDQLGITDDDLRWLSHRVREMGNAPAR